MSEEIKEIPLKERIEKLLESGWVNEFNYLESQLQEARYLVVILQQKVEEKNKEINRLSNTISRIDNFVDRTVEVIKQQPTDNDEWILERLNGIKYLTEGNTEEIIYMPVRQAGKTYMTEELKKVCEEKDKEIDRLNSIIASLEKWLNKISELTANIDEKITCKNILDKIKVLKENTK